MAESVAVAVDAKYFVRPFMLDIMLCARRGVVHCLVAGCLASVCMCVCVCDLCEINTVIILNWEHHLFAQGARSADECATREIQWKTLMQYFFLLLSVFGLIHSSVSVFG